MMFNRALSPIQCFVKKAYFTNSQCIRNSMYGSIVSYPSNLEDAYTAGVSWLSQKGVEDAEDSARHLISHATSIGTRLSDFNNNQQRALNNFEVERFQSMCIKRADRWPVQYIVGNWDFYGLTLQCAPPTLIPRPETEELVELILGTKLLQQASQNKHILDVGAGTGAIGLALLTQLSQSSSRSNRSFNRHKSESIPLSTVQCTAVDVSAEAVGLANRNGLSVLGEDCDKLYRCLHTSFKEFVFSNIAQQQQQQQQQQQNQPPSLSVTDSNTSTPLYDLIVSNPPYIPSSDLAGLQPEIRLFEDPVALDGGADGLDMVRELVFLAPALLRPREQGGTGQLWLEVSEAHPQALQQWVVPVSETKTGVGILEASPGADAVGSGINGAEYSPRCSTGSYLTDRAKYFRALFSTKFEVEAETKAKGSNALRASNAGSVVHRLLHAPVPRVKTFADLSGNPRFVLFEFEI
jgi:release factor glutamine methyltransferase